METPPIEGPVLTDSAPLLLQGYLGPILLVLIFLASAGVTTAYLSNTHTRAAGMQTAAGAVAEYPFSTITLSAQSAYVLDLTTSHVLYSLNPDAQLPLASLTKVPLALVVSEVLSPDTVITIPRDTSAPGSAEHLGKGERWHVADIIHFTLVASSNEGAEILAQAANDAIRSRFPEAPAEGATLWRMNNIAHNLGLLHTYFLNASGLDMSATQAGAYGSARDTATLFAYAATSAPGVFAGTARGGLLLTSLNGNKTSAFNTDKALGEIPGLIMGKTGSTDLAGGNLAIVFDVGPSHPVVTVVLHSTPEGRFEDIKKLVAATEAAIARGQ